MNEKGILVFRNSQFLAIPHERENGFYKYCFFKRLGYVPVPQGWTNEELKKFLEERDVI